MTCFCQCYPFQLLPRVILGSFYPYFIGGETEACWLVQGYEAVELRFPCTCLGSQSSAVWLFIKWFVFGWQFHLNTNSVLKNVSLLFRWIRACWGLERWNLLLTAYSFSLKKKPLTCLLRTNDAGWILRTVLIWQNLLSVYLWGTKTNCGLVKFSAYLQALFPLVPQICTHREGIMVRFLRTIGSRKGKRQKPGTPQ